MLVLLLPLTPSADRQTRQKDDGSAMSRVLDWLKDKIHPHGKSAETTHETDTTEVIAAADREIEVQERLHRAQVIDDLNQRDRRVDRRIEALEQFAAQIRRKRKDT